MASKYNISRINRQEFPVAPCSRSAAGKIPCAAKNDLNHANAACPGSLVAGYDKNKKVNVTTATQLIIVIPC